MTDFGDTEPEDAWSPSDPVLEQLRNILARLALLAVVRDADVIRLRGIVHHLEFIRDRLDDG